MNNYVPNFDEWMNPVPVTRIPGPVSQDPEPYTWGIDPIENPIYRAPIIPELSPIYVNAKQDNSALVFVALILVLWKLS